MSPERLSAIGGEDDDGELTEFCAGDDCHQRTTAIGGAGSQLRELGVPREGRVSMNFPSGDNFWLALDNI